MNRRGIHWWWVGLILLIIGVVIVLGFVPILSDLLGFGEGETASALEKLASFNKVDLELDASVQEFVDAFGNRQLGKTKIISLDIENSGRETAKDVKISYTIAERTDPNERYYVRSPEEPGSDCVESKDCSGDKDCINGYCAKKCTETKECSDGKKCINRHCVKAESGEEKTLEVDVASKETKPIAFSYEMKYPFETLEFYAEHSEDYSKEDNYETVELEAWCETDSDCKTAFGAYAGVVCEKGKCIVDCEAMGDDLWQEDYKICLYYPDCEVEEYRESGEDMFRCVTA